MNDIRENYFIRNMQPLTLEFFDLNKNSDQVIIYEVIRVINGRVLFYNDHLERFQNSLTRFGYPKVISRQNIKEQLFLLLEWNKIETGNIKFLLKFSKRIDFYAFFIPHQYPSEMDYINGVRLSTMIAERLSPQIKQQHNTLNNLVQEQLNKTKAYEILLVRPDEKITEGSKSNFFLIHDKDIYTACEKDILAGITRKHILLLCKQMGINLIEKEILLNELENFDAAFISGTSPKILPVKSVNNIHFKVNNSLLIELMKGFDKIIEENLVSLEKI